MERHMVVKDMKEHLLPPYPLYESPKKDGVRAGVDPDLSAWCRPRKNKPLVQHKDHIQQLMRKNLDGIKLPGPLDGELVIPGLDFNDASSGVKGSKSEYRDLVEFHMFDLMIPDMEFMLRWVLLKDWYNRLPEHVRVKMKLVPTNLVFSWDELQAAQDRNHVTDEGTIIRSRHGLYTFDKSTRDVVRWKYKKDAEFLCVDIIDGKGKNVGVATFVCETDKGLRFNAASTGELPERKRLYEERDTIIGKMVTIQYQNLNASGIPRFGTFKAVRDYE